VGTPVPGSGYLAQDRHSRRPCAARRCNTQNCALCHGADGLDQRVGDKQVFRQPGAKSFNWVRRRHWLQPGQPGFIQANMPLGRGAASVSRMPGTWPCS
jgi:thiosulfate dehydrogenase